MYTDLKGKKQREVNVNMFFHAMNYLVFFQTIIVEISKRKEKLQRKRITSKTDEINTKWKVYDEQ